MEWAESLLPKWRVARPSARSGAGSIEPEAIAHRAYELFENEGAAGREFDDWLHAEHELRESNDDNAPE